MISWYLESGDLLEGTIDNKYIRKLRFHIRMQQGTEVSVLMQYDDDPEWHRVSTFRSKTYRTHAVPIIPRRCQKYRYRLEGCGGMPADRNQQGNRIRK